MSEPNINIITIHSRWLLLPKNPPSSSQLSQLGYSQGRGSSDCLAFLYYTKHLEATIFVIWLYINKSELTITNIHKIIILISNESYYFIRIRSL